MRLTALEQSCIKQAVHSTLGEHATVRLFGSRTDDSQRGGDIDLLIETTEIIQQRVLTACRLAAVLERRFHGRKVDVLLLDPSTAPDPVYKAAREHGIVLS